MKPVTLFYQPRCPFCKKALGYLEELQRQEPYSRIEIRMIDELAEPEVADRYDYYYVPTFYVGDKKCTRAALPPQRWSPYFVKRWNNGLLGSGSAGNECKFN